MSRSDENQRSSFRGGRNGRTRNPEVMFSRFRVRGFASPRNDAGGKMIPGELFIQDGEIELNAGRKTVTLTVANSGDRPIQVGSHYHFFETNPALKFDRKKARGRHRGAVRAWPNPRCAAGSARGQTRRLRLSRRRDGEAVRTAEAAGAEQC